MSKIPLATYIPDRKIYQTNDSKYDLYVGEDPPDKLMSHIFAAVRFKGGEISLQEFVDILTYEGEL